MARAGAPRLFIAHRQRSKNYDRKRLELMVKIALPFCLRAARRLSGPLASINEIEISIINPSAMARLHRHYFNIEGPTDVITFPYGEIFVCAAIAAARAQEFGNSVTDELALYVIHGLLHLAGHDDRCSSEAARMMREQERILRAVRTKL